MATTKEIQNYVAADFGYYSWFDVLMAFKNDYIDLEELREIEQQCMIQYYNNAVFGD